MQRKNPFAPEAKTVRSVRNPVLERNVRRASPPEVVDLACRPTGPARRRGCSLHPSAPTRRARRLPPRHVDGASDLRTLVDVTGMTELEVTSIVEKLLELGVVEVR